MNKGTSSPAQTKLPEALPPNKAVATSVFNAVLNQIESSDEQGVPTIPDAASHQPASFQTLDPASLPYNIPAANNGYPEALSNGVQPPMGPPHYPPPHGMGFPPPHINPHQMPPHMGHMQYPPMGPPGFVPNQGPMNGNAFIHTDANQHPPVDKKGSKKLKHMFKNTKARTENSKKSESSNSRSKKRNNGKKKSVVTETNGSKATGANTKE